MKFIIFGLVAVSVFLGGCGDRSSTEAAGVPSIEKTSSQAVDEIYYIDEENGVKATLIETAGKVSSFMLCASYFNDNGQSVHAEKSMELFQILSSVGYETWSKTVFVKSVAAATKNQLDANSIEKIGAWCDANITPMVVQAAEDEAEEYNRRSKYFSFPLRCAQLAMYAFKKPDNQAVANMHIKYVEQKYAWTMDDLKEADTYIKKQFQEKRKRYPAQMRESDLLQMMYANDFSCNDHK